MQWEGGTSLPPGSGDLPQRVAWKSGWLCPGTEATRQCVQDTTALSLPRMLASPASARLRVAMAARADPACPFLHSVLGGVSSSGAGTYTARPANDFQGQSWTTVGREVHGPFFLDLSLFTMNPLHTL